jgi:hypothetical protein
MPTPPDQPIPPVKKLGPTPRPKIARPTSLRDALKTSLERVNAAAKSALIGQICAAGGRADAADGAIIAKELQKLPLGVLQAFKAAGCKVVVCRGSITDYRPELKGVVPRGWEESGRTWDSVPGEYNAAKKEVVIAVIGHGFPAGPHCPGPGEGHGSANLLVHEMFHGIDQATDPPHGQSEDFNRARALDLGELDKYERQGSENEVSKVHEPGQSRLSDAETAGQQETYAESAARFFAGESSDEAYPHLHEYWQSNSLAPRDESSTSGGAANVQPQTVTPQGGSRGGE